ncbi:thiol-disulfide oxidoreductase DCC family protein [Tomitella biformata]|uniref:thiol-disulfide oxidoreductase DCC family protein n=1 Tax=Tomitella biformata TaxID=630403 RepID=UPI001F5B85F0|nr:DUF393 domain-containing protein [Tomitella biformata]
MLYDADCGFCTQAVGVLGRVDRKVRVRVHPLQSAAALRQFGLTREAALEQLWSLDEQGRRHGGAEAANVALSAALGFAGPLWLYRLPGVRWCQDQVYRAVAANRYRLPGSAGSCALDR